LFKQDIIDFDGMFAGMFVCVETLGLHREMTAIKGSFGVHASFGITVVDHCRKN
jgi:hypothetical protein